LTKSLLEFNREYDYRRYLERKKARSGHKPFFKNAAFYGLLAALAACACFALAYFTSV